MKKIILYVFMIFSLMSCEKKTDWSLQNQDKKLIIIDGTITDESKRQSIKLTFPVSQLNETPIPVSGATVVVSNEDSAYTLTEIPANSGIYKHFFRGTNGDYNLLINYKNNIFTAKTTMLPYSPISQQLKDTIDNNDSWYHIIYVANAYDAENFAMYEILLDWSKNLTMNPDSSARLLYYTLPTIDVSQIFAPAVQSVTFPANTIITEKKYSITREHAEYIRALLSETNWQGGLFDATHANLPTNLSGGAYGFFAACGVTTIKVTP
jgi:hypothetical protein